MLIPIHFLRKAGTYITLFILMLLTACGRPFIEEGLPEIVVLEPDLSTIFVHNTAPISISATSFRSVHVVNINGHPIEYNSERRLWEGLLLLQKGLNIIIITAVDVEGLVQVDTVFAVHYPFTVHNDFPTLPEPRGGHTATMIGNGKLLVIGGSSSINSGASNRAFILSPSTSSFSSLAARMNAPRTGHTATRLPDGRVLLMGGSRRENITAVSDLVEFPEVYDPETDQFLELPLEGHAIRRTQHTASLYSVSDGLIIDLYGGLGDIQYGSNPVLGTRGDLRRFFLRNDTLIAIQPSPIGYYLDGAIAGHSQERLRAVPIGQRNRYLISGTRFTPGDATTSSFVIDYERGSNFETFEINPFIIPRTRHASERLQDGNIMIFGGHQGATSSALNDVELYIEGPNHYFRFPHHVTSFNRFGHTATKISPQRILLLGGFSQNGNGLTVSEVFETEIF